MKPCNVCNIVKADEQFATDQSKPDGMTMICRDCNKEKSKRWYRENRERHIANTQAYKEAHGRDISTQRPRQKQVARVRQQQAEEAQSEYKLIRFTVPEWLFCLQMGQQLHIQGDNETMRAENYVRYLVKDAKRDQGT